MDENHKPIHFEAFPVGIGAWKFTILETGESLTISNSDWTVQNKYTDTVGHVSCEPRENPYYC
jgi:hypothetical protein